MKILVFSREYRDCIKDLEGVAEKSASVIRVRDENDCRAALTQCMDGETILIFFITNEKEMAFLETQARYFIDMKLIICLESSDAELSARAYRLKPRLVLDPRASQDLLAGAAKGIMAGLLSFKKKLSI